MIKNKTKGVHIRNVFQTKKCYVINKQDNVRASLIIQKYLNQECKRYQNNSKLEKIWNDIEQGSAKIPHA